MSNGECMNRRRRAEAGYTYLLLLFGVAAMGLVAATAAESWSTLAQRERERELLFAGNQYREALRRYYEAIPEAAQRHPGKLDDLLRDTRFAGMRRHLRQLYPDPMTGETDWVLLRQGERIIGVHSRAAGKPIKQSGFEKRDQEFAGAASYADWKFAATTGEPAAAASASEVEASVNRPTGSSVAKRPFAQP
jgi:type II secretory pathway pseudopilin PulG